MPGRPHGIWRACVAALAGLGVLALAWGTAVAAPTAPVAPVAPVLSVGINPTAAPAQVGTSVEIILALTVLSLAPSVLLLMTSFTRIIVVLSFARNALGTGQLPPNQILIGLALFLTAFIMAPTFGQIYKSAWQPYQAGTMDLTAALTAAEQPLSAFMLRQTEPAEIQLFTRMGTAGSAAASGSASVATSGTAAATSTTSAASASTSATGAGTASGGQTTAAVPLQVLIPAFVVSELKVGFEMGFVLFIPFVVIDLVVASTLMAMGMVMLPPMLISLPFKVLLFVLVDGWTLLVQSLVMSFH